MVLNPVAAIVVLGYTLYRNVYPYPPRDSDAYWFPVVAGGWLAAAVIAVGVAPGMARKLGTALATREGIMSEDTAAGGVAAAGALGGEASP